MFRSIWASAGASVLAFALTPGAALAADGASSAASHVRAHASHTTHHRSRPSSIRRARAAHAGAGSHNTVLAPGSGYDRAGGSGRVRALQHRLAASGLEPGPVDGRYGPLTTLAVERFQSADGLVVDGIAGSRTLRALDAMPRGGLSPGVGYAQAGGSRRVRVLQRRLRASGFAPGPVDGRYGPLTTLAVVRFQSAHGLPVNGIVGVRTLVELVAPQRRRTAGRARGVRAPQSRPVHAPRSRPVPPRSISTRPEPARPGGVPLTVGLLVLAMLGLATAALSYARTRARVRRTHARLRGRVRVPPAGPGVQRIAGEDRGGPVGGPR